MLELNESNYFSPEAQMEYMSASQFKAFQRCEAAAMAELTGEYQRPVSDALLFGSIVDAALTGNLDEYLVQHPELLSTRGASKGQLLSRFSDAVPLAERIRDDTLLRMLLDGEHQVILTGTIGGVAFKCKVDSRLSAEQLEDIRCRFPQTCEALDEFAQSALVDLKSARTFELLWDEAEGVKKTFVELWGYDIQGAVYQTLAGDEPPFIVVGATKDPTPDIGAWYIPQQDLNNALRIIEYNAPRYAAIKRGEIAPVGCGECDYCRQHKKLVRIANFREMYGREDD